jgi:hypothetical protein
MPEHALVATRLAYATHPAIRNKPPLWQPAFASDWQNQQGTLQDLRDHVSTGGAFIPAALSSPHRSSAAFTASDLAVVDIDHGLTVAAFLEHPLAASAAWIYTTASHTPQAERFRIVFRLPRRIDDPDLYKAIVTLLTRSLGGDRSCTDPCRLFYGNAAATHPLWAPDAQLPDSLLDDAAAAVRHSQLRYDHATAHYDERTILQAIFCLEQVLAPTTDGQRDHFIKVTAAASSAGEAIYPAWCDWASRGHHGSGKNARQASERFFRGFHGRSTLATIFYLADEEQPGWRQQLPEELRGDGSWQPPVPAAGYDHEDFLGLLDAEDERPRLVDPTTPSLFDLDRPWTAPPPAAAAPTPPGYVEDDSCDDDELPPDPPGDDDAAESVVRGRRGRPRSGNLIQQIKDLLQTLYPGLRLNAMSLDLEYGSRDQPRRVHDISTAYVRISRMAGGATAFSKTLTADVAQIIGHENRYHPVRAYLEHCAANVPACPYFHTLASELLGLFADPSGQCSFPDGRHFDDVILERFLIGAVARVFEPGCVHDWMPILIGGQNAGKSTFFRYLTPPSPSDPGNYPWISTVQQGIAYIKERPHLLHAGWLVLLDETERYFKRQYVEELKNLVSVSTDRSARKYENERDFPRSFVLCGATNSNDFLVDPTGNRRFMPVLVKGKVPSPQDPRIKMIDLDRLKRDRDAIWAAAYKAYLDGAPHTWQSYELSQMAPYLEGFITDSPLDTRIHRVLELRRSGIWRDYSYITLADLCEWLDIPLTQAPAMQRPITDALKRLGWRLRRPIIAGKQMRIWIPLQCGEE